MEPTYIVLIILAIIYVPIWFWVKLSPKAKEYRLSTWGPAVMIRTRWGLELMGKLGRYKRFWRYCGVFSRIVVLFLMVYIVSILVIDLLLLPSIMGQKGIGVEYALAIPGINPMLPLVYGWIALIVAMCVHEMAHGIQTRANDMNVDSSGVLYGVVPLGAFVEPNEEQLRNAKRRAKFDVYAAGITTNFCLAIVCFALMFGMMTAGVNVNYGDNIAIYGTSDVQGCDNLENTSIITGVGLTDGERIVPIDNMDQFYGYLNEKGCTHYTVQYLYHSNNPEVKRDVIFGVYVNNVVGDSPASMSGIRVGDFIVAMNGERIGTIEKWSEKMKDTKPGQEVDIEIMHYANGQWETLYVRPTLTDNGGVGFLGVSTTNGGYNYTTPNELREASINPLYGREDLAGYAMGVFTFIGKAFQGFSPVPTATQWWYESTILPDNVFWIVVSLLFWIFWLNMVLGVTNAIPAVPFDGGFLYAGGLDYIMEKFGVKDEKIREEKVGAIVSSTSMIIIAVLVFVMLAIII